MTHLVQFPIVAVVARKICLQGLESFFGITGVDVATRTPSPMPAQFIKLVVLPGREICQRTKWVQVIAEIYDTQDEMRCLTLANRVAMVMRAAPDMVIDGDQPISEPCELTGPLPSQDPDMPDAYRQQVTATWTLQSTVVTV